MKVLSFPTVEALQASEELQGMGRYGRQEVIVDGRKVIACTTNQQYEDIIYGGAYKIANDLNKAYDREINMDDFAAEVRDKILEILKESYGIEFVDVFDEY